MALTVGDVSASLGGPDPPPLGNTGPIVCDPHTPKPQPASDSDSGPAGVRVNAGSKAVITSQRPPGLSSLRAQGPHPSPAAAGPGPERERESGREREHVGAPGFTGLRVSAPRVCVRCACALCAVRVCVYRYGACLCMSHVCLWIYGPACVCPVRCACVRCACVCLQVRCVLVYESRVSLDLRACVRSPQCLYVSLCICDICGCSLFIFSPF